MRECEIREKFLGGVKTLLKDEKVFKYLEKNLPKKKGFFRYVPLCELYKKDFFKIKFLKKNFSKKSFLKKEDIEKFILSKNYLVLLKAGFLDL
jgi:hypothetical protein